MKKQNKQKRKEKKSAMKGDNSNHVVNNQRIRRSAVNTTGTQFIFS